MMNNEQIARSVNLIANRIVKETKSKVDLEAFVVSKELVINVLQNLNDIARALREIEMNTRPNR